MISLSNVVSWDRTLPIGSEKLPSIWLSLMKKEGGETGDEADKGKPLCCTIAFDLVVYWLLNPRS